MTASPSPEEARTIDWHGQVTEPQAEGDPVLWELTVNDRAIITAAVEAGFRDPKVIEAFQQRINDNAEARRARRAELAQKSSLDPTSLD